MHSLLQSSNAQDTFYFLSSIGKGETLCLATPQVHFDPIDRRIEIRTKVYKFILLFLSSLLAFGVLTLFAIKNFRAKIIFIRID